jgi:hypothetical protein
MDNWHGFKVGDEVTVNLTMIPHCDPGDFNNEPECQVTVDAYGEVYGEPRRLYLRGFFPGYGNQLFWIDDPASIRHVAEISEEIIRSSTQELASWIKELT